MHYDIHALIDQLKSKKLLTDDHKKMIKLNCDSLFGEACRLGSIEIAKWLYDISEQSININQNFDEVFRRSCQYGYINIVKYLYDLSKMDGNNKINICVCSDFAFKMSCENGHFEVAKYLYGLSGIDGNGTIDILIYDNYIFRKTCENGHTEIAKWLYDIIKININDCADYAFRMSCANGHLKIAKWLYELGNTNDHDIIDINRFSDYAFRNSCQNGHIQVAKWLYDLSTYNSADNVNTKINIYAFYNEVFVRSCQNDHIAIVEWLYHIDTVEEKNNKFYIDDDLFKKCCNYGSKQVAKWMCTINPHYSIKIKDGKIVYKIKNIKEVIKKIYSKYNYLKKYKLFQLYKNVEKCYMEDITCPFCLSKTKTYQIKLQCNHTLCAHCFIDAYEDCKRCHYRCEKYIDFSKVELIRAYLIK
jgi:hypothetical protein